jgi:hypothetical protein
MSCGTSKERSFNWANCSSVVRCIQFILYRNKYSVNNRALSFILLWSVVRAFRFKSSSRFWSETVGFPLQSRSPSTIEYISAFQMQAARVFRKPVNQIKKGCETRNPFKI